MDTNENNAQNDKRATDKLHNSNLGETKDFNELLFDKNKNSYELDVKSSDKEYDHPLPYETSAENGGDDNSDYDEANPYIGDEYTNKKGQTELNLDDMGMHIDDGDIVELKPEDEYLSRTPEDNRKDLDEEGYPVKDDPELT